MRDLQLVGDFTAERFGVSYLRLLNVMGVLICVGGLGFAYYAQFYLGMEPCPLCIFQRLALLAVGLVFLLAAFHNPHGWGAKVYGVLVGVTASVGASIAARQVWLQRLPPDEVPRCGPGLDYMLQNFPLTEAIREVLTGSGECAKVDLVLGLSVPIWTLLLFIGVGVMGAVGNWWLRRR
jgi:disulfide bond formation protein DsbB